MIDTALEVDPTAAIPECEHFEPDLARRIVQDYNVETLEGLDSWQKTPLNRSATEAYQEGDECIESVRLLSHKDPENSREVLIIPGYLGNIPSFAPFAAELASSGFNVTLPNQNRTAPIEDEQDKVGAIKRQALNIAAVIEARGLQNETLDVVAHSLGAPIFAQLVQIAKDKQWRCFEGAKAALVAPAGLEKEPWARFKFRFSVTSKIYDRLLPVEQFDDGYADVQATAARISQDFEAADPRRARRELYEATRNPMDLEMLQDHLARVALVELAGDRLFSNRRLGRLQGLLAKLPNVVVFTPVSSQSLVEGQAEGQGPTRGRRGSSHGDPQQNPRRVAGAVADFFKQQSVDEYPQAA